VRGTDPEVTIAVPTKNRQHPPATARATSVRTSAILATDTFGTPCDVEGFGAVAQRSGIRLFFDAAHAFGSRRAGVRSAGSGTRRYSACRRPRC
jgi:dTDP-4-amino-4,6-dideoxygalactose transaminase